MLAIEICTRPAISCRPNDSVIEAARKMRDAHIGNLVVTEKRAAVGEMPIGVVTDRDLVVQVVAADVDPNSLRVGDIMSRDLYTVDASAPVRETIEKMRSRGVRRLPVVDKSGALVGIIALDDLLRIFAEDLSVLAAIGARARATEARLRDR